MKKLFRLLPIMLFAISCLLLSCRDNKSTNRDKESYPETGSDDTDEGIPKGEEKALPDSDRESQSDSVTVGPASPKKSVDY
ncbi:hypothetical protein CLV94_0657 [Flavobacterium endophyticum]|uniref:Uncharacterized protein n=1 Tax=Flavobacterium endophyticum TaxID=1540163 RepID=A0A495MML0_9FLAO|nr:hypothetical protein [Flavobacterium endophyticum]RKS25619.1 hypothetical protein CLV94_0657 [Flavobacterium endophyticum]